jgi:hypothetical protein
VGLLERSQKSAYIEGFSLSLDPEQFLERSLYHCASSTTSSLSSVSDKERARIIRNNVIGCVIRGFFKGESVADPMQFTHAQTHCRRKWAPVWYEVRLGKPMRIERRSSFSLRFNRTRTGGLI